MAADLLIVIFVQTKSKQNQVQIDFFLEKLTMKVAAHSGYISIPIKQTALQNLSLSVPPL